MLTHGHQSHSTFLITCTDNDYGPGPYILTIPSGDISASFNISITDDNILETMEEFFLCIDPLSLPDDVTVGSEGNTTVVIVDNDRKCCSTLVMYTCILGNFQPLWLTSASQTIVLVKVMNWYNQCWF